MTKAAPNNPTLINPTIDNLLETAPVADGPGALAGEDAAVGPDGADEGGEVGDSPVVGEGAVACGVFGDAAGDST